MKDLITQKTTRLIVALLVAAMLLCPVIGNAQSSATVPPTPPLPPPPPPISPSQTSPATIPISILDSALNLSEAQEKHIDSLQEDGRRSWIMRVTPYKDRKALQEQVDAADAETSSKIIDVLNDQQKPLMTALVNKITILSADELPYPIAAELDVSDEQLKQIKAVNDASLASIQEQKKQFQTSETPYGELPQGEGDMFMKMNLKRIDDVAPLLTSEQQDAIILFADQNPRFEWFLKHWRDVLQKPLSPTQQTPSK